jgi:hypothetical protein
MSRSATKAHREHARVLIFEFILRYTGKPAEKRACPWHPRIFYLICYELVFKISRGDARETRYEAGLPVAPGVDFPGCLFILKL